MSHHPSLWAALKERCDTIEGAYEFALAYAAQGLAGDEGAASSSEMRDHLVQCDRALSDLDQLLTTLVEREDLQPVLAYRAFVDVLAADARQAASAIQLVLAQPVISSQLVDNLNASIHLRALLTDLFLIDEILKRRQQSAAGPP